MHFAQLPLKNSIAIFPSTAELKSTLCNFYCRNSVMLFDHSVSVGHTVFTIYRSEETQVRDSASCFWSTAGSGWSASDLILLRCLNCTESYSPQTHTCCSEATCSPCIHCLGADSKIRPLFRINCMSSHRGANFVENKNQGSLPKLLSWSNLIFHLC